MAGFEKIGEYLVRLPDLPDNYFEITGFDLPHAEQMWQRTELPGDPEREIDWDELREEELLYSCRYLDRYGNPTDTQTTKLNPDFLDEEWVNPICENFRQQEWNRRKHGFWFYNNGIATYITGVHYFYINWWKIDIGYPNYRNVDRRFFLLWKDCEDDTNCYGLFEIARRRSGKSWRASVIAYEYASRNVNSHIGMQSKEGGAAKEWFTEKVIGPWKELPHFFLPITNSGTDPIKELSFKADSKKGQGRSKVKQKELRSKISWGPSVKTHYDGQKLKRYIADEIGKTVTEDIHERHYIVKKCCEVDGKVVGKMFETTTVEEMEKGGGRNAKKLWNDSNPENIIGGRTTSGLRRIFFPAYEGYVIDNYGNDLLEESKRLLLEERERFKHDSKALASEKRKNPFTIMEAFRVDGSKSHFDSDRIQSRLDFLGSLENPLWSSFSLEWENNKPDTKVTAKRKSNNARFKITYLPDENLRNNVSRTPDGKPHKPLNKLKYVIGVDPFDHENVTNESKQSNAAAYVFRKYDPFVEGGERRIYKWQTNRFVVEYLARPKPKDFYEDMIKLCVFFGCELLMETQKIGLRNYMKQRGYYNFLMDRPESTHTSNTKNQKEKGLPASALVHEHLVDNLDSYISEDIFGSGVDEDGTKHGYCDLVDFENVLEDWLEFDIENTQEYDATIGSGYSLIGAHKHVKQKRDTFDPKKYFHSYDNSGMVSEVIDKESISEIVVNEDERFPIEEDTYDYDKYLGR